MAFRFKRFAVEDVRCTMKVGTDAVLLGAWVRIGNAQTILDIGTGSGVIALMAAQRSEARIDAIDLDRESVVEARANFEQSIWKDRLHALHVSLEDYAPGHKQDYDLIISNPPYLLDALKPGSSKKDIAKHTDHGSVYDFIKNVHKLLAPEGRFSLIYPVQISEHLASIAMKQGLHLNHRTMVIAREGKKANLNMLEFGIIRHTMQDSRIVIMDADANYTEEYKELTVDFYLDF